MFAVLKQMILIVLQGDLNPPLQDYVNVTLFFGLVHFRIGLELNNGRGDTHVDERLRFHVEELGEKWYALEALCDLHAFEGHALGIWLAEHLAQLRGFGFDLHFVIFHYYFVLLLGLMN